jgi:preprotein translocase subunit SecG
LRLGRLNSTEGKTVLYVLYTIHVVVSIFLILVVLLQQGKGADLSVFGGGGSQAAFGARGAATLLHKLTVAGFVAFIITTTGIGFLSSSGRTASVMATAAEEQPAEQLPDTLPAAEPVGEEAEVTLQDPVIEESGDEAESPE